MSGSKRKGITLHGLDVVDEPTAEDVTACAVYRGDKCLFRGSIEHAKLFLTGWGECRKLVQKGVEV